MTLQLWSILAVLTLAYFFFGNSISYQQSLDQTYQTKYAQLKTQRDELVAMERYWAIEVEGLKKEEQRQLVERRKLEQRADDLRERERFVAEQLRKESEAHTPFQENGPVFVKHIVQTKCGADALTNYSIMHRLRRLGNLKPSHLLLSSPEGHSSLAEKLATFASAFALSFQLGRAFFVENTTLLPLYPLFETVAIDWKSQPSLAIPPLALSVLPLSPALRELQVADAFRRINTSSDPFVKYITSPIGSLESLHAMSKSGNLSMSTHLDLGCILHQLLAPSKLLQESLRDHLAVLADPETFTMAIFAPSAQLVRFPLTSLFLCGKNIAKFHALHGSRIRWFLVTDVPELEIPAEIQPHLTQLILGTELADATALYTLAYSRVRILTEGLLGRMGALLSLRFSATYYLPTNSLCGPEDTTALADLKFTYP